MDGTKLTVAFDPARGRATVSRRGKLLKTLAQERRGQGTAYAADGFGLHTEGEAMTFTAPGLPPIPCTVIR
jgi:hypothetical protein